MGVTAWFRDSTVDRRRSTLFFLSHAHTSVKHTTVLCATTLSAPSNLGHNKVTHQRHYLRHKLNTVFTWIVAAHRIVATPVWHAFCNCIKNEWGIGPNDDQPFQDTSRLYLLTGLVSLLSENPFHLYYRGFDRSRLPSQNGKIGSSTLNFIWRSICNYF